MALTGSLADEPDLDYVEFFSGAGTLANAMRASGRCVETFDKKHHAVQQDLNTSEGASIPRSIVLVLKLV